MAILRRARPDRALSTGADQRAVDGAGEATGDRAGERAGEGPARPRSLRLGLGTSWPLLLLRAAHPRQGVLTALGVALAALLAGRLLREVGLVLVTVLVGQAVLGWHNDLVDRDRDRRHRSPGKPVAEGRLEAGTVWFALGCGLLLLIPLSVSNGVTAGSAYLLAVVAGLLGNVVLRKGRLSWVSWAVSFALLPAFVSYGGWGGAADGAPPEILMTALGALLGIGVHVLCSLRGLVADNEDGWRTLPLRIALRTGAPRLLVISLAWTVLALAAMLAAGSQVGLSR